MPRCLCLKIDGKQCTREAKIVYNFCWQHKNCINIAKVPFIPQRSIPRPIAVPLLESKKPDDEAIKEDFIDHLVYGDPDQVEEKLMLNIEKSIDSSKYRTLLRKALNKYNLEDLYKMFPLETEEFLK